MIAILTLLASMHTYSYDRIQCKESVKVLNLLAQYAAEDEFYCEYVLKEAIRHRIGKPAREGIPRNVCKLIKSLQLPKVDA
jgi:hypothetical protein